SPYPYVLNNLVSAVHVRSSASTGTTMSSSSAVVPGGRAPATAAYSPLRTCHCLARDAGSLVSSAGADSGSASRTDEPAARIPASSSAVAAWYSTSSAACARTSTARRVASARLSPWATRRDV